MNYRMEKTQTQITTGKRERLSYQTTNNLSMSLFLFHRQQSEIQSQFTKSKIHHTIFPLRQIHTGKYEVFLQGSLI